MELNMDYKTKKFRFRIIDIRSATGLTGDEFGALFDVGKGAVGKWERGVNWPSTEILIAIADKYDISLDYLTGRTDFKHSIRNEGKYIVDSAEALSVVTSEYDDVQKGTITNMVKMLDNEVKEHRKSLLREKNENSDIKNK